MLLLIILLTVLSKPSITRTEKRWAREPHSVATQKVNSLSARDKPVDIAIERTLEMSDSQTLYVRGGSKIKIASFKV